MRRWMNTGREPFAAKTPSVGEYQVHDMEFISPQRTKGAEEINFKIENRADGRAATVLVTAMLLV